MRLCLQCQGWGGSDGYNGKHVCLICNGRGLVPAGLANLLERTNTQLKAAVAERDWLRREMEVALRMLGKKASVEADKSNNPNGYR